MRRIAYFLVTLSAFFYLMPSFADDDGWEQISEGNGITVYRKEVPGSPVIAFKGHGILPVPMLKIITVLLDESRSTNWVDKLVDAKLLSRKSKGDFVLYSHIGTPVVMKDREFITQNDVTVEPKTKTFTMTMRSVDPPNAPKTKFVRGVIMDSSFTLRAIDAQKTYVSAEIHADPKGSVPKWIVNMFQKQWPRNTIESLWKESAKADVVEDPYYKKILF